MAASLEPKPLLVVHPVMQRNEPRRRVNALRQAIPLPLIILVVGVAGSLSIWKYLRDSKQESVISDFKRDAWTIANQITNRVKRDVNESYTASFMGLALGDDFTLESWKGFTQEYLAQNADGSILFCPRVRNGNTAEFELSARLAYPKEERFRVFSRSPAGEKVFVGEGSVKEDTKEALVKPPQDMYPILYANPEHMKFIGYDMNSVHSHANAILQMTETNFTAIAEVAVGQSGGLPSYAVVQPVFAGGHALGGIVGCAIKWTAIQQFVDSSLFTNKFTQRYPDAEMAVFMRIGVGLAEPEDQLLYDRRTYPNRTKEFFLSGSLTPSEVKDRGTATMFSVEALAADKAVVVVSSYKPPSSDRTSTASLSIGCVASLLIALLVYGRQLLVLSYKDGMERAAITSSFKLRFVADMAHEIRTPLNGIIGTAELLEEETLSSTGSELVGTVRACSTILMGIVNDALDYSKTEIGEMRMESHVTSLRKMILEVIRIMKSAYRSPKGEAVGGVILRLEVDESVSSAPVLADEARIRQVLVNLISNAFKFTDAGSITVTARYDPALVDPKSLSSAIPVHFKGSRSRAPYDRIPSISSTPSTRDKRTTNSHAASRDRMRCSHRSWFSMFTESKAKRQRRGTDLHFVKSLEVPPYETAVFVAEVKDTGVGMTPQQMDGLFKPFSQVHHGSRRGVGGTGLGLAICKSLCESMGGSIGCTSRPGEGSTFRFTALIGVNMDAGNISSGRNDRRNTVRPMTPTSSHVVHSAASKTSGSSEQVASQRRAQPRSFTREWNLGVKGGVHRPKPHFPERGARSPKWGVPLEQWAGLGKLRGVVAARSEDARSQVTHWGDARGGGAGPAFPVSTENVWLEAVAATSEVRRAKEVPRIEAAPIQERPRFLVVDDFRMNRLLVRKMVESLDVEVKCAEDGAEAVRACRETRFSLIFMDVMMPVMDGLAASKSIRAGEIKLNQGTPIIAVTASPTLEDSEGSGKASVTDVLIKPITRKPLFVMIAKWSSERDVAWMSDAWLRHTETIENRPELA